MTPPTAQPSALITGGGRGIGRAVVDGLRARGWHAIALDLSFDHADDGEIVDITNSAALDKFIATLAKRHGQLAGLVNAAGISHHQPAANLIDADWQRMLDVHVGGTLRACRAAYPMLKAGRGAVVNFSSLGAHLGRPARAAYAAAKGGIEALTRTLATEWAQDGVRVNAVAPGIINTPMLHDNLAAGRVERASLEAHIPLGRLGEATEIASVVAFLLSSDASYLTGQTLIVDGGATIDGRW